MPVKKRISHFASPHDSAVTEINAGLLFLSKREKAKIRKGRIYG